MISTAQYARMIQVLKGLVWLYIILWVFEGALRKWVVPSVSTPLLIVRDPVLLGIFYLAIRTRLWPSNWFVTSTIWLAILSLFTGFLKFPENVVVPLFGLRASFLHLPLIFIVPKVFSVDDVRRVGNFVLVVLILMTPVMVMQFRSSPEAWWNATAGGEGAQLGTAGGKIRAAGFFSFISGPTVFLPLCVAYILESQFRAKTQPIWLLIPATVGLATSVAVSGSRGTMYGVLLVVAFGLFAVILLQPKAAPRWIVGGLVALVIMSFLTQSGSVFSEGAEVMQQRTDQVRAAHGEGEILQRVIEGLISPLDLFAVTPLLGHGLGMGTNVGSQMLTGETKFLLAEGEWQRNILESGPILGILFIGLRIALVVTLGSACIASARKGNVLPWLLFGASFLSILNGQLMQTTLMGFAVIAGGLCVAAMNDPALQPTSAAEPELGFAGGA